MPRVNTYGYSAPPGYVGSTYLARRDGGPAIPDAMRRRYAQLANLNIEATLRATQPRTRQNTAGLMIPYLYGYA